MLEILPSPDNVGAYKLSATVQPDDYDKVIEDIEARLKRHDKIGILADLTGFQDITVRALLKDFGYACDKMRDLKRFKKEALVTDKQWLRTFARVGNAVIPFVEIRAFRSVEFDDALAWAADIGPAGNA